MSKKSQSIERKYQEKLNTVTWCYNRDITDYEKARKDFRYESNMYENLLTSMLMYNLISSKDFEELWLNKILIDSKVDVKLWNKELYISE